jgi:4-hydroxythreonine-4-phosphate dehydrogenase
MADYSINGGVVVSQPEIWYFIWKDTQSMQKQTIMGLTSPRKKGAVHPMARPLIAVPMGDPAGIGPELVLKAAADPETLAEARCAVIGDRAVLERAMAYPGSPRLVLRTMTDPAQGDYSPGILNLLDLGNVDMAGFAIGQVSGMCGRAAYEYIESAVRLALSGRVDAVATPPINKESFRAGGIDYIGHTEIFAALTGTRDPLTLFQVRELRIFFLTRHIPLSQVCRSVTKARVMDTVRRCTEALHKLGVTEGVMAVAGLNPHSGEHGLFGDEEEREIRPAVEALLREGYRVAGPISADSVFAQALHGRYNSVLSLYHDQGHIAAKTLDFDRTVAITAGMPILRTSVDHGTAFDIAGKGLASAVSLCEAIRVAARYSPRLENPSEAR